MILLLCGIPCSGKTAIAQHIHRHFSQTTHLTAASINHDVTSPVLYETNCNTSLPTNLTHVSAVVAVHASAHTVSVYLISADDIYTELVNSVLIGQCVTEVNSDDTALIWHECRRLALERCRDIIRQCQDREEWGIVIIDDNNVYKSMRRSYRHVAEECNANYMQIYVHVSLPTAIDRHHVRMRSDDAPVNHAMQMVNNDVIVRLHQKICKDVSDEQMHVIDSDTCSHVNQLYDLIPYPLIVETLAHHRPAMTKAEVKLQRDERANVSHGVTDKNVVHQCDIYMRRLIGEYMKHCSGKERDRGRQLNNLRVSVLNSVRHGELRGGDLEKCKQLCGDMFQSGVQALSLCN